MGDLLKSSPEEGLKVLTHSANLFPRNVNSHHNLAKAYAKTGNFEKAVYHQKDAVKITDSMQTWYQKRHLRILNEYQQKVDKK